MSSDLNILYAEDNEADFRLMQEAFEDLGLTHQLHNAVDGEQALAFLRRTDGYSDRAPVDLLVLDLNLPRKSGLEVLVELAADPSGNPPKILVLTTAAREQDVRKAAGGLDVRVVTKALDYEDFLETVRLIDTIGRGGSARR